MKLIKFSALALVLGSSSTFAADCTAPPTPELPNGATSTMEQMLEGQQAVKSFQAANLEYMKCLEPEIDSAQTAANEGEEGAAEHFQQVQDAFNAAVSAEEALAGQFNTEVREYKAAHPN